MGKINDFDQYKDELKQRLDPTVTIMQGINNQIKKSQKKVVFADGEDENTLRAAIAFKNSNLGIPVLIGKKEKIKLRLRELGLDENFKIEISNSLENEKRELFGGEKLTTNNRMELMAAIKGLEYCSKKEEKQPSLKHIKIIR